VTLAGKCEVITYEFENVAVSVVEQLEKIQTVHPGSHVLRFTQNRVAEKSRLLELKIKVADFEVIKDQNDLERAVEHIGLPAVLKTTSGGYNGKGQYVVKDRDQALTGYKHLNSEVIWERFVPFAKEVSVICARTSGGEVVSYPVAENIHRDNILYMSIVPARISPAEERKAKEIAETIASELGVVGVIGVEMFLMEDGSLLVNEIAPRPHNSGHYTLDACHASQFEQQLRAICGLPLASTALLSPVVMINILGEGSGNKLNGVEQALNDPNIKLHLYGKIEAKAKRKMGHLCALAENVSEAIRRAEKARGKLRWGVSNEHIVRFAKGRL
ncbi:5-(carboxyamino)imidazole ribonucleotide synthase, partial [Dehalococcoidales bacterium]|nr:5-(carboxyamino)imidazole ribonucleotide synthase [Dehalococcoidales bacterium]